jgi:GT2 family glycosyltransferase
MQIMGRCGVLSGRAEMSFPSDPVLKAINPSIIVWQRQTEDSHLATMRHWRELLPDAFFVFEVDDALSAVPSYSWHAPYMTPNIDEKIRRAVALCDAVTVTTVELADHMRSICEEGTDIRVVPNMLGRDDLELTTQIRKQFMPPTPGQKLRIGWGGGIGHAGDLAILSEAFIALKDEVEWVFLGMDPPVPEGVHKTYAGASPPDRYLASLASINVDLIVAPLEDNLFNRCKSNLRLVEAGACAYPTIASPVGPYLTDCPPLFAYAATPAEWISAIRSFIDTTAERRRHFGQMLHTWVKNFYILDDHAEKRLAAWLPKNVRPFKPALNAKGSGVCVVANKAEFVEALDSSEDILYLRPGATYTEDSLANLKAVNLDVACALTNDGGPWGFPTQTAFSPVDSTAMAGISLSCAAFAEAKPIDLVAASGPAVLCRRSALAAIGSPDLDDSSLEIALLEWSCAARARGLKVGLCPSAFVGVPHASPPLKEEADTAALRINSRWPQGKSDEAALKALREELEFSFYREHFESLPPQSRSDYTAWANACDTRGEATLAAALEWGNKQQGAPLIEHLFYPTTVVEQPGEQIGDWRFFVPAGAQIAGDFYELLKEHISRNPEALIVYADNDFITDGKRVNPDFKPNFDLFMLLSRDYVTQALAVHSSLIPANFEATAISLYELVLTQGFSNRKVISHLPRVLAHLPPLNFENGVHEASQKAKVAASLTESLGLTIRQNATIPLLTTTSFASRAENVFASIIIPCKDNLEMLAPCIATILKMTSHNEYEILIVDNGSTREDMLAYQASLATNPRIRLLSWPQSYNWSALNNFAVKEAKGEVLVFLNDDTRVMSSGWLAELIGAATLPTVATAGARLTYPHGYVQHVGVVCNSGLTGHIHKGLAANNPGVNGYAFTTHESTAVTGACLAVTRHRFEELGGFDESFPHDFNDVAFCLEAIRAGYLNIVCSLAELQHFEGVTRHNSGFDAIKLKRLQDEGVRLGQLYPEPDPYWNPNLALAYAQNGMMLAGMDLATYSYPPPSIPWQLSKTQRVLLFGPSEACASESHDGAVIYKLSCQGNVISISLPELSNAGPWDIRRPDIASAAFRKLGIDKVVFTSLDEAPLQLLSFFKGLGVPVIYRPSSAEAVCPRGNLKLEGDKSCDFGYSRNLCQSCMNLNSSPYGNVLMPAWYAEWFRFLASENSNISVELDFLSDPAERAAVEHVYGEQAPKTEGAA